MTEASSLHTRPPPLSPKERGVFDFISCFILQHGYSPSFSEVQKNFGFASINSVQNYIKQLSNKGYVDFPGGNLKRALQLTETGKWLADNSNSKKNLDPAESMDPVVAVVDSAILSLPFLGKVAAGLPIEVYTTNEFISVPTDLIAKSSTNIETKKKDYFVLQVSGDSMVDEGIWDDDYLIVHNGSFAKNGDLIVASVQSDSGQLESTVKRFYDRSTMIELRPSNSSLKPRLYTKGLVQVRGQIVGLMRKYG